MNATDIKYLKFAKNVALYSHDPSTKVGCVIVDKNLDHMLCHGSNNMPLGIKDSSRYLYERETKYASIIHAEENAILNSGSVHNLRGAVAYVTHQPCAHCASLLIQVGIRRVVSCILGRAIYERNVLSFNLAKTLFKDAGVELVEVPNGVVSGYED